MKTPERAGILAGSLLALAALAAGETGCNPEAKRHARESTATAIDFAKYTAVRCRIAMADPDKKNIGTPNVIAVTHESSSEQTETCVCEGLYADAAVLNARKCSFTRGMKGAVGKQVILIAADHGLRDAERFTVYGTGDDGRLQKIHFVVKGDDCEVDDVSIDKENCDAVRAAVSGVVDEVVGKVNVPRGPENGARGIYE